MKQLFDGLEINCDRMCCGVEAFSFAANQIQEVSSKLKLHLTHEINQIITKVESIDTNVVGLTILNQNFEKKVFIKLLNHIKSST